MYCRRKLEISWRADRVNSGPQAEGGARVAPSVQRPDPPCTLLHSGKVRDVYADGDDVILVASDRMSIYDVVLPTPLPGKGPILTQLSLWWFSLLADVCPNHVISATDVPAQWSGRAI